MSGDERLELHHAHWPHVANLALCAGLVLIFLFQAISGVEGAAVLLLPAAILFGGSSTNRTVTLAPEGGRTGSANVTITVSDGTDTASRTFRFTVRAKPAAPANLRLAKVE